MPNWCVGSLKLRGPKNNIINFFENGIDLTAQDYRDGVKISSVVKIEKDDDCCEINIFGLAYIKETARAFIDSGYVYLVDDICTVSVRMQQAWGIISEDFLAIAKKYNIDIRIQAFEKGMEFARDVEIVGGKITKDETIEYDDYIWDCPMPNMGG